MLILVLIGILVGRKLSQNTRCKVASVATCVKLADSGFEPSLLSQKA